MITIINKPDSITAHNDGISIKTRNSEVFLSWEVIDEIAEVSEPHYQAQVFEAFAALNGQKQLN